MTQVDALVRGDIVHATWTSADTGVTARVWGYIHEHLRRDVRRGTNAWIPLREKIRHRTGAKVWVRIEERL